MTRDSHTYRMAETGTGSGRSLSGAGRLRHRPLQLVDNPPLNMGPDIYAKDKAKRESIDWDQMWIRGDKNKQIFIPDRVKRPWIK